MEIWVENSTPKQSVKENKMSTELAYTQVGNYLLPNLKLPDSPKIGIWGERRRQFLREHRRGIYSGLLLSGRLNTHLEAVDREAERMFDQILKCLPEKENVTEALKAADQMLWVQKMNSIRSRAEEIIYDELIYR